MESVTDVTGHAVRLLPSANRIVSLVPSMTETLYRLGHADGVVGVTRYCVHPAEARNACTTVGGTKSPHLRVIESLNPDLVLANKEENRKQDIDHLRQRHRVYVSMPNNLPEAIDEISRLGRFIDRRASATEMTNQLEELLASLKRHAKEISFTFVYLIWREPYMSVGGATFVDALLTEAGGVNVVPEQRYPEVTLAQLRDLRVDHILLSSEPFPFDDSHQQQLRESLRGSRSESARIHLVDGELLSWHGARLLEGIPYASSLARMLAVDQ